MENKQDSQANSQAGPPAGLSEPNLAEVKLPTIVLASGSVRRAEILRRVGWNFETKPADIDETRKPDEDAVQYVRRLAREKAEVGARLSPGRLVLGADTTVVLDGDVLGKPRDDDDARVMLRRLSAGWHEVVTGVALISPEAVGRCLVNHEVTRVLFAALSNDEINTYVATGEPMDKAGAYAIQGHAALFIERIEGDYWNIVGLPVRLVYKMTQEV